MDIQPQRTIWQISGGPSTRSYADVFLKCGVGLIGPGDAGEWRSERDDNEFDGGFVRRFASEVRIRDIILLRTGISKIAAVGVVYPATAYIGRIFGEYTVYQSRAAGVVIKAGAMSVPVVVVRFPA